MKYIDKMLIAIGRKLYIVLLCCALIAIVAVYAVTRSDRHILVAFVTISITMTVYSSFQVAIRLRPKCFSFTKMLEDRGITVKFRDDDTFRVLSEG